MKLLETCVCVGVTLALGCGDGDGASSGVDGSRKLTALTDDDARKLCVFLRDDYKSKLPGEQAYCTASAAGGSTASCERDRDECILADDYENEQQDDWECADAKASDVELGADCEATVADYQACRLAENQADIEDLNNASCAESADQEDDERLAACQALVDKCPAIDSF